MKIKLLIRFFFFLLLGFLSHIDSYAQNSENDTENFLVSQVSNISLIETQVHGRVYRDVNGNGTQDTGEPGLPNIDMIIVDISFVSQAVSTDANGDWSATVEAGPININVDNTDLPPGYIQTEGEDPTAMIALPNVDNYGGIDGYYFVGDVTGHLYFDLNGNGTQDTGEPDMPNVDVVVTDAFGVQQTVVTNADGDWEAEVAALNATADIDETDPDFPAGAVQTEGVDPSSITVIAGQENFTDNDGFYEKGFLSGHLYFDYNGNGAQDAGEPNMPNITVTVTDSQGQILIVETDIDGYWEVEIPAGPATDEIDTTDVDFPANAIQTEGTNPTTTTVVNNSSTFSENDGFYQEGELTGHLYFDINGNGVQDTGEPNMMNVTVQVTDFVGTQYFVVTDVNGNWDIIVPAGETISDIDETDPDFPAGAIQTEGSDPTSTIVLSDQTVFSENDGFFEQGELSGHLYFDLNGNGLQDVSEPDMPDVDVLITDSLGQQYLLETDVNGNWSIQLPIGNATSQIDENDSDFPISSIQTQGTNPTTTLVLTGQSVNEESDGFFEQGSLSGHLFFDVNGNGTQDSGEPNMPNVEVFVTDVFGQVYTAISDVDGNWIVNNIPVGNATILVNENDPDFPTGAIQTAGTNPSSAAVIIDEEVFTEDDGWYEVGILVGHLYYDANNNGIQDSGEPGLENIDVLITDALGNTFTVTTNANGDWQANVPSGPTTSDIDEDDPDFLFELTDQTQGTDPTTTTVTTGNSINEEPDGFYAEGDLSGHLYYDTNGNGVQDVGEPNLPNVTVTVTDVIGNVYNLETDLEGNWVITIPIGEATSEVDETDPDFPSNVIQTEGTNPTQSTILANETVEEIDGYFNEDLIIDTLSGHVYYDVNGNGQQDPGEPDLANITVQVTTSNGGVVLVETDADGNWSVNVPLGNTISLIDESDPDFIPGNTQTEGTNPTTTNVVENGDNSEVDGFFEPNIQTAVLTGHLYFDYNNNGDFDAGDANMPNVDVQISNTFGQISIVTTDDFGVWTLIVPAGDVTSDIDENDPDFPIGYTQTEGTDPTTTTVVANTSAAEVDDGFYNPNIVITDISGHVYYDTNGDGVQQDTEPNLANITIEITDVFGGTQYVETNADGDWSTQVPEGNTVVLVDETDVDFPTGSSQTEGANPTTQNAINGNDNSQIDGYFNPNIEITQFSGQLYYDTNGNGTQDVGEPNLPNVEVLITTSLGSIISIETDEEGNWSVDVPVGQTVTNINVNDSDFPTGAIQTEGTNPTTTTLTLTGNEVEVDGFYLENIETAVLSGHVYYDYNGNGNQENNEADISELNVFITNSLGLISTIETDANGDWSILVPVGNTESKLDEADAEYPTGFTQTEGTDPTVTNVITGTNVEESDGFYDPDLEFTDASGHVYYDSNGNGVQDTGEPNLGNIDIIVTDNFGAEVIVETDADGNWSVNVPEGNTIVFVDTSDEDFPTGSTQTEGTNPTTITVEAGSDNSQIDGFYNPNVEITQLSGHLYYDTNGNSSQNSGEPNIANVEVIITTSLGNQIIVETDENGNWSVNVPTGVTVSEINVNDPDFPAGAIQTQGSNPTTTTVISGVSNEEVDGFYLENIETAVLTGHVYYDYSGNGNQEDNEADISELNVFITNSLGLISTIETDANGDWSILVPVGNTESKLDEADPEYPTGFTQTEGTDPTITSVLTGNNAEENDGFFNPDISIGTINGHVYYDTNGNGVQDPGEPDLPNIDILITDVFGGNFILETDENGNWTIDLPEGDTQVTVDVTDVDFPTGAIQTEGTNPTTITIIPGNYNSQVDGFHLDNLDFETASGHLYYDTNGNGQQDTGEPNLPNVTVTITNSLGIDVILVTDINGNWSLVVPEGNTQSLVDESDPDFPIGASQTEGSNPTNFTIVSGDIYVEEDGFVLTNLDTEVLSGHLYFDFNGNGVQDANESDMANVDVVITTSLGFTVTISTDENGNWSILTTEGTTISDIDENDPDFPTGLVQTQGTDPTTTEVTAGSDISEVPDGFFNPDFTTATLSGHLYYDTNGNGTQDSGEPNIPNVNVTITDFFGGVQTLVTDANGNWSIEVPEGSTISNIDVNDPDFPIGAVQTEGTNPTTTVVTAGGVNEEIDGYSIPTFENATLSGHLYYDTNGNGDQNLGEPDLPNVDVEILNSLGLTVILETDANGNWSLLVPEGSTESLVDETDADFPVGAVQTEGTNPTVHNLAGGQSVEEIDGYTLNNINTKVITGHVYYDSNGNGTQDLGEPDLPNIDVEVINSFSISFIVETDVNGDWSLLVPEGSTTTIVDETDPDFPIGSVQTEGTNPSTYDVEVGIDNTDVDGYNNPDIASGELSGHIYYDTNGNGTQDTGEPNLPNITVTITDVFGAIYLLESDVNGDWIISVPEGNTTSEIDVLDVDFPIGATQTEGTNPTVSAVTGGTSISETDGFTNLSLGTGEITGHLYYDIDGNGTQDSGEPNLPNIDVEVTNALGIIQIVETDINGDWLLIVPEGLTTSFIDETDPDFIVGAVQTEGTNPTTSNVSANATASEIDGYTVPVSSLGNITGHIYIDANGNGVQDATEPNMPNVDVLVTDFLGGQQIVTSNATGDWTVNVIPGEVTTDIDEADPDFPEVYIQTEGTDPTITEVTLGGSFTEIDGYFVPEFSTNTVNGHIYFDTDGSGNQDVGEIDLANIEVEITDELGLVQVVISDSNGDWTAGVPIGEISSLILTQTSPTLNGLSQSEGTNPTITQVDEGEDYFEVDGFYIDEVEPNELEIFNAVSPNGDGQNDYFRIEGIQNFPDNKVMIFNRWGTKVYEVSGYGQNEKYFRGYSEGRVTIQQDAKLPSGVYFYILEVKSSTGEILKKEGYLYIN
ncbi:gliding motility-associated C-terminal domain-containing protein [Mesonia sp.]|uniref:T9SS type B sorting domain-containing protein n=1 Tax=Mesonia sp. TaxID=1960830 RepID=UPI0017625ECB|nr:gliding motility-associated C-terminal domain-containing protein [Mesonia sp.]HIB38338.1 T9SS type B sorting domain-containing protein [Mesonia sp.]HIO26272.1 T9SS type B sorting domain-containing protein [Flavobacteriaceae bacterium]